MNIYKKLAILLLIIFAFSSLSYAAKVSKSEKTDKMPPTSESSGDAKGVVEHKNALLGNEGKLSNSEGKDGDKKGKGNKNSKDNKGDGKNQEESSGEEQSSKKQKQEKQGDPSDHQKIQEWLENLLGHKLNLNDSKDKQIFNFWCGLLDKGYSIEQVHSLIDTMGLVKKTIDFWYHGSFFQMGKVELDDISDVQALFNWVNLINQGFTSQDVRLLIIVSKVYMQEVKDNMIHRNLNVKNARDVKIIAGWCLYRRKGYSATQVYNLFKSRLTPAVKKLLGKFDAGFFTYFTEEALAGLEGGLDYICNLLNAMAEIKGSVEELIGKVDLLDDNYQDNGFLTYWAQQAVEKGTDYVKQHLYIWKQLLPYIEKKEGRTLNLFNPDDSGILDYWAQEVEKKINQGTSLTDALQKVIQIIQGGNQLTATQKALIPYIEKLLAEKFDQNNSQQMGFLSYWAQRADKEGLEKIKTLLQAMIEIKDEIETLVSNINFFDKNDPRNGFLTYWAERAINEGVQNIKNLLQAMIEIKTSVESLIGNINLLDTNSSDDGFLTYWSERALQEGIENIKALFSAMKSILPEVKALIVNVNLLDKNTADDGFLTYWAQKALSDGVDNVKNLLSAMKTILPEVENLIGQVNLLDSNYQDNGFLSYWAEQALANGITNIKTLLQTMADIKPNVEALIGSINLFDKNDPGNGFLTYWAQKAVTEGTAKINQTLYIWKQLLPSIEQAEGRTLDLFNPDDSGIVSYWASEVQTRVTGGMSLQDAIAEVIQLILNQGQPALTPTQEALVPYIEALTGADFNQDNPEQMGFLSYWAERADKEGLQGIKDLLTAMADILPDVKALIGNINLFDKNDPGNGFLTYWAQKAVTEGTANTKALLSAMADIKPNVEALIGSINLFDKNDPGNGFLTYWAQKAVTEGTANTKALLSAMADIKPNVEALIGSINLFDKNDPGNGFLTYWAEQAVANGTANTKALLSNMASIKPSLEALVGSINLLDSSYDDNGLLTFWAQYAQNFGLQHTINIINNMAQIKDEVESLIGPVNLYDNQYDDNGFLTYWAEQALTRGVEEVKRALYIWKRLLPYVEENEGRKLNLFDPNDSGIISYWESEVRRLMQDNGLDLQEAIQQIVNTLK